jgi:hypothetical protein|tara:strand:+ start:93 stop:692 length:600 start_codon:yes stop_codon:yes gene_type:complete
MAYPTVDAPYGLKPVNLIGGQVFAGSTRQIKIASNYGTAIFYGDVVKYANDGTLNIDSGTTTATPIGVFLGCTYTDPSTSQLTFRQSYPASTVASDIMAYVLDDPDALFKVAAVSGTTTVAGYGRTIVNNNVSLVQNTGSSVTGNSKVGILGSSAATTATLPIRIVDVVPDTATASDTFVEFIVKFNFGDHQYYNATGV